jgi:autotransporter-associated beta strand protein
MKSKYLLPSSSRQGAFALLLATSSLIAPTMAQTVIDWSTNAGTTAWATGANWVGNSAPTSDLATNIAQFNQSTYTSQPNYGTTSIAGIIVGNGSTAVGPLTLSGTQLNIGASGIDIKAQSGTVALNNAVRLGASQTWTNNSASLFTVGAAITNNGNITPFTLTIDGSGNTTITGAISNGGTTGTTALVKNGTGTLVLSAANAFTGGFTINDGRVNFGSGSGLGANNITIGGSNNTILDYTGGNSSIANVTGWTLTGSGTVTRSNSSGTGIGWGTAKITGSSGGLIYTAGSAGAVIQVGAVTSDYTGGTTLTSGTIVMNGTNNGDTSTAGTFGNGSVAGNVVTLNGASIRGGTTSATRTIFNNISFTADTTLAATSGGAAGTLTWAGEVTLNGTGSVRKLTQASATQDTVFSNTIKNGTVSDFTVDFTGTRSVSLGAANTFNGTMLVTGTGGGGLALAHVNALQNATLDTGSATASRAVTFTAAGTNTYNIGALQGADDLAIGANTISVGAKAVDTTFSGAISGTGGLTKSGSGKLTLTANNPYTGVTNISGGTLALTGTASVASSSSLRIAANTTLDVTGVTGSSYTLATTQSISGTGTIVATGKTFVAAGTLTPGNSPGTLVQDGGAMQLAANGNFNWEIADALGAAGTGYDSVSLIGGAVLDLSQLSDTNRYNINLITLSSVNPDVSGNAANFNNTQNYTWTLFSTGSAIAGFNSNLFTINATGFTNDINGGTFSVALADSNTDLILRFTAIPEPSTALLGGLGILGLLRRRRK